MKKLLPIIFILLVVGNAWGATYYVAATEQGSGGGLSAGDADSLATYETGAAPYDNLHGDTVYLLGTFNASVTPPVGGGELNRSVLRGDYPGQECLIDGEDTRDYGINLDGIDAVTVYKIEITNTLVAAIKVNSTTDHVWIQECVLHDGAVDGISGYKAACQGNKIIDNTLYNFDGHAIYLGIDLGPASAPSTGGGVIISGNEIYSTAAHNAADAHHDGITIRCGSLNTVFNNYIHDIKGDGIITVYSDSNTIKFNTVVRTKDGITIESGDGNEVYNNTIIDSVSGGNYPLIKLGTNFGAGDGASGNILRNNIMHQTHQAGYATSCLVATDVQLDNDIDYNTYWYPTREAGSYEIQWTTDTPGSEADFFGQFASWVTQYSGKYDQNSLNVNPRLTSAYVPMNKTVANGGTLGSWLDSTSGLTRYGSGPPIGAKERPEMRFIPRIGPPFTPVIGWNYYTAVETAYALLLETGDTLLLESGDKLLLE